MMLEFWQKEKFIGKKDLEDYKIVFVNPVSVAESKNFHLLLITENGHRIYINFEIEEEVHPTLEKIE